jgi:hypothetical protein
MIAFRRWVREIIVVIMAMVVMSEAYPRQALESLIRRTTYILIPFSLVLVRYYGARLWPLVRPHGVDWCHVQQEHAGWAMLDQCLVPVLGVVSRVGEIGPRGRALASMGGYLRTPRRRVPSERWRKHVLSDFPGLPRGGDSHFSGFAPPPETEAADATVGAARYADSRDRSRGCDSLRCRTSRRQARR